MKLKWISYLLIILFSISCKKEIKDSDYIITGETSGYNISFKKLDPFIEIHPQITFEKDTLLRDSITLAINDDGKTELTFIIEQLFLKSEGERPISQKILIKPSDGFLLQYHPSFNGPIKYLGTETIGKKIDLFKPWVADSLYILTEISGNFTIAPRKDTPYIPFNLNNSKIGWIKFGIDCEMSGLITRFYICEFAFKSI